MKKQTINFYLNDVASSPDAIEDLRARIKSTKGQVKADLQAEFSKERSILVYVRVPGNTKPIICSTGWKCSQSNWLNGRLHQKFDSEGINSKIESLRDWIWCA
jgi:hypothetical protein